MIERLGKSQAGTRTGGGPGRTGNARKNKGRTTDDQPETGRGAASMAKYNSLS